jgi:hypothetical protein
MPRRRRQICGRGINRITKSVRIVAAALAIQVPTWLMQWPGSSGYHNFWTGTQMKMKRNVMHTTQAMVKEPTTHAIFLKYGNRKMR